MVMKWIYRIATLLIMLAPGMQAAPGALAIGDGEDTAVRIREENKKVKFKGYRIYANPAEYLLNYNASKDEPAAAVDLAQTNHTVNGSAISSEDPERESLVTMRFYMAEPIFPARKCCTNFIR